MCSECHQSPCATMCPNGDPMVDEVLIECALCGKEIDEETATYGVCEQCWNDHHNIDNALAYGETARQDVSVNGFYAKLLTPDMIAIALQQLYLHMQMYYYDFTAKTANEFLADDDGDFADWLKRRASDE